MNISPNLVKFHIDTILLKLGIQHNTVFRSNSTVYIDTPLLSGEYDYLEEIDDDQSYNEMV